MGQGKRPAPPWPFVGRGDELCWAESVLQSGAGVLAVGDPGVGKTALAEELARRFTSRGASLWHILGHAVSGGAPFEAFAGALVGDGSGRSDVPEDPTSPVPLGVPQVAARVADSLHGRGDGRPMMLVDDAHLLDERSAQVLLQVVTTQAVSAVLTARQGPLPDGVDRLWRDGRCERLELTGFDGTAVGEALETYLEAPVEAAAARAFTEWSQGNPLLLRELVRAALQRRVLVRREDAWVLTGRVPLSRTVRDLVSSRIAAINETQRLALETIAAGEPLPVAAAAGSIGDAMLDELDAAGLVAVEAGLAGPTVRTAHPLYGEVLRADLPPLRLRRLRLTLANRLEATARPSPHDLVRAALWRMENGETDDPERLLVAARAARVFSLETAERLARHVQQTEASLRATVLLAEILTHTGRGEEASRLLAGLPPESLPPAAREAMVYCAAVGERLATGDAEGGAQMVADMIRGEESATAQLRGLHSALLAFDGRFQEALQIGSSIVDDPRADPVARTNAAIGVLGAEYWLGRLERVVAHADALAPLALSVRDAVPFGAASVELLALCALIEQGLLDEASERGQRMLDAALAANDAFAGPRAEYSLGKVALLRGQAATAVRRFRRCLATVSPFDRFMLRHLHSMLALAYAVCGDVDAAVDALCQSADETRMKTYEPEWQLAEAALMAAQLRIDDAAEHAAWAASVAADREQWGAALIGYHDAARYGVARNVLPAMRAAASHVDGTLAWCYLDHAAALAAHDGAGLDEVARRFELHGAVWYAADAAAAAALAHTRGGDLRAARSSADTADRLRHRCEGAVSHWLSGVIGAVPLTDRERQIAGLAAAGETDHGIARQLRISPRTVQTHLSRVYAKLGINSRVDLVNHLDC